MEYATKRIEELEAIRKDNLTQLNKLKSEIDIATANFQGLQQQDSGIGHRIDELNVLLKLGKECDDLPGSEGHRDSESVDFVE